MEMTPSMLVSYIRNKLSSIFSALILGSAIFINFLKSFLERCVLKSDYLPICYALHVKFGVELSLCALIVVLEKHLGHGDNNQIHTVTSLHSLSWLRLGTPSKSSGIAA